MRVLSGIFLLILTSADLIPATQDWMSSQQNGYTMYFTESDRKEKREYIKICNESVKVITGFFGSEFKDNFGVYIHPNRQSLNATWQKDWGVPDFQSECWMVASGVSTKLDVLSPLSWDKEACEHRYADEMKTQQLFAHELVHVFHGQHNPSPDFSNTDRIDWFIEGLATFASGQCDSDRIASVKKALTANETPASLDNFWKGNLKYGLSGSMVMYLDAQYGRNKLKELLGYTTKEEVLNALGTSEADIMTGWSDYLRSL